MAKKKSKKDQEKRLKKNADKKRRDSEGSEEKSERVSLLNRLSEQTLQAVMAIILFVLAVFFILAHLDSAGVVGRYTYDALASLMGVGSVLVPVACLLLGISFIRTLRRSFALAQSIGVVIFLVSSLGLLDIILRGRVSDAGGVLGGAVASPLLNLFELYVTVSVLIAMMIISLLVIFDRFVDLSTPISSLFRRRGEDDVETQNLGTFSINTGPEDESGEGQTSADDTEANEQPAPPPQSAPSKTAEDTEEMDLTPSKTAFPVSFTPPPLKLLARDSGKPGVGDIKSSANVIKRTLANFNVQVEMDEVSVGPTVTRYALKPAEGVKLSRIQGLKNDLALALAASRIRIEAPIPGKSLVGIEIPNTTKSTVGLGTLIAGPEFGKSDKPLLMALGKGITGDSHFANLAKMPHILIAGATGSGKSVSIHSLITSLLYRNSPDYMRFIMIDPKRVELTLYNSIPHLLTPVITDPKRAILALKWAQKEMNRRYDILEAEQVRDISSYHEKILKPALAKQKKKKKSDEDDEELPEKMPYTVIIIDELADIMQAYPRELESAIVRLAQMSRAVGIHLILSTQRPSVNVITGLIKANVPSRVALQVASQVDSRTILDTGGAESLLGAGDMLYMSGEMSKPVRLQSAFISEEEVKKVVQYLSKQYESAPPDQIDFSGDSDSATADISLDDDDGDDDDELYEIARETVISMQKASTSLLQRKLKIGYSRAARITDALEERGVISPQEGSKPREILIRADEGDAFGTDEMAGYEPPAEPRDE